MIIYPTIELQNGRCVSLIRGLMDQPEVWHIDPVERARLYAEAGAEWMQVTDLDAVAGTGSNAEIIQEIIIKAGIPVQVAGGVRSMEHVEHWIDQGAGHVVIGTAAVRQPNLVKAAAKLHPDQIVMAVDFRDDRVVIEGRTEASAFSPAEFVKQFAGAPLAAILLTDVNRDLDEPGSSIAMTSAIARETDTPVISSGLVKSLDDVSTLKYVYNIAGVIIGRALFQHDVDLAEAIRVARPEPERVAEFQ
ncbi:MAG: 1-(5-phosphoribosyl)-5-[(5-phosphoribosylamino)methylideneamino] imidazole-4-carboxamide isomerase [Pseudomonadota bacterium]